MRSCEKRGETMGDLISRKAAIDLIERMKPYHQTSDDIAEMIHNMPSAQPETHEKRTETHACDCISRQAAIDVVEEMQTPIMRTT